MPDSFGARLRRQREQCGIALSAIAKQTRIKESLLEALERDDLSQWPTGFYRRAFFRAYAVAIQLDPDAAASEFQSAHPEPPEADVVAAMAATLGRGDDYSRTTVLRSAVESAFNSLSRLRPAAPGEMAAMAAPESPVDSGPDLSDLAQLCVDLGCVSTPEGAQALLHGAARMIRASGLIVWVWNPRELQLRAALFHGYSPQVVAQLPTVRRGDNNATAVAFSSGQTRVFNDHTSGKCAIAIPLRTASECIGVFAVELERGVEATRHRVAVATLLAAQVPPVLERLSWTHHRLPRVVNTDVQTV